MAGSSFPASLRSFAEEPLLRGRDLESRQVQLEQLTSGMLVCLLRDEMWVEVMMLTKLVTPADCWIVVASDLELTPLCLVSERCESVRMPTEKEPLPIIDLMDLDADVGD